MTGLKVPSYAIMRPLVQILAVVLLVACSGSASEAPLTDLATTGLSLATAKSSYSVAEVAPGNDGIRAMLTAAADKAYYAKLGDAFNGALVQNPLFIAEGTDGVIERQSGDAWVKVSSGILVEGAKEVMLSPGKTYDIIVTLSAPVQAGTYRLQLSAAEAAGGDRKVVARSASFQIR